MTPKLLKVFWAVIVAVVAVIVIAPQSTWAQDTCRQGFVWREAFQGDYVCVTPETRAQAAQDNSQASARRQPGGGASGPDTCLQGYVWREARPNDLVCVTPETRAQAASDNAQASARRAVSAPAPAPAAGQDNSSAEGRFFALIVNGSPNLLINYDGTHLFVRGFRRTVRAAGAPSGYVRNVPPGTAAWPDRPLNGQEPLTLKQRMSPEQAKPAIERLQQNGGYWKFYCRNTGAGYFEVSRSEPAYASVRID
jgi:hypothetical protein